MQHSAHNASGRREDRVPLAALVSVRVAPRVGAQQELIEADGLNVSIGGIAMRARMVPEPGATLECSFASPATGELVTAHGEVMWSEPHGLGHGQFGLRFVELDTKSATALRRLVRKEDGEAPKLPRMRAASLRIDGVPSEVEAELKLVDDSRVVLEQPLSFLQLGRGVEVVVPGRSSERGRIASVELRQGAYEAPRLVFGILLDPAESRVPASTPLETELEEPFPAQRSVQRQRTRTVGHGARPRAQGEASARSSLDDELADERISEVANDRISEISLDQASARSLDRASQRFRGEEQQGAPTRERRHVRELDTRDAAREASLLDAEKREAIAKERARLLDEMMLSPTDTLQGIGGQRVGQRPARQRSSEPVSDVQDHELCSMVVAEPDLLAPESPRPSAMSTLRGPSVAPPLPAPLPPLEARERESVLPGHDAEASEAPELEAGEQHEQDEIDGQAEVDGQDEPDEPEHEPRRAALAAAPALDVSKLPANLRALFRLPVAQLQELSQKMGPALMEQAESLNLPEAKSRLLSRVAGARAWLARPFKRRAPKLEDGEIVSSTQAPRKQLRLRMQRSTLPGIGNAPDENKKIASAGRTLAYALAVVGFGLGAYALAPRGGADRIELPERIATAQPAASAEPPLDEPIALEIEPARKPAKKKKGSRSAELAEAYPAEPKPEPKLKPAEPKEPKAQLKAAQASALEATPDVFGDYEVPNGRTWMLNTNGVITSFEGRANESGSGFVVTVPDHRAIDVAKPIVTAHRAVSRAIFITRNGTAELTIEFHPSYQPPPRYQVKAEGSALKVTLERPQ